MNEYGVFNDKGLLEGDLWSAESAECAASAYHADDGVHTGVVCPECRASEAIGFGMCDDCDDDSATDDE